MLRTISTFFKLSCLLFLGSLVLLASPSEAFAQLKEYGYIVGTLNKKAHVAFVDNVWYPYGLEKIGEEGKFLHYRFKLDVNGVEYECVIDVNDATIYPVPYRILDMRNVNAKYYNGILGKPYGFYRIPMTTTGTKPGNGGLDFIRHPGILRDMAGANFTEPLSDAYSQELLWFQLYVKPSKTDPKQYIAPDIDALFENATKIYVFGEPYRDGRKGMHNIHQNQGNRNNIYIKNGGIYQDGGVIFEYSNGDRVLLMVKFGDYTDRNGNPVYGQSDFSYTTDIDGKDVRHVAEGAPYIEEEILFDASKHPNGVTYGPFYGDQIEVVADVNEHDCMFYNDVDIYLWDRPEVNRNNKYTYSQLHGCRNEYVRASKDFWEVMGSSSPNVFYIHVFPWESDSYARIYIRYR